MSLLEEIEFRINRINNLKYPAEEEYEFFADIAEKITKKPDLSSVITSDMFIALLTVVNEEYPFEKITDVIYDISDSIDYGDYEEMHLLLTTIYSLKKVHLLEPLLECKTKPDGVTLHKIFNKYNPDVDGKISNKKDSRVAVMAGLLGYNRIGIRFFGEYDKLRRFSILLNNFEDMDIHFAQYLNYKSNYEALEMIKFYEKHKQNYTMEYDGDKEKYEKILKNLEIEILLSKIKNHDFELSKDRANFIRKQNKKLGIYNQLLELLFTIDEQAMIEVPYTILSKLNDDELSNQIIKTILEHNRVVYSNLMIENIKKDNYNAVEKLFYKYSIDIKQLPKSEEEKIAKFSNYEELETILSYLKTPQWDWLNVSYPGYADILVNTSIENIKFIDELLKTKTIPINFIQNNPEILISEQSKKSNTALVEKHQLFVNNFNIIMKYPNHFANVIKSNIELLLMPTEELLSLIALMKQYELNLDSKNAKLYDLCLLNHPQYFDDLDTFIEMGYKDIVIENPQLLRHNTKEALTRLSISQAIGLETINTSERFHSSITSGKNFYIESSELSKYELHPVESYREDLNFKILNQVKRNHIHEDISKMGIITYLDEQFKISELEYQIQDVIISRMKVLRNMEALINSIDEVDEVSVALSAIIYHSVIDNSTIDFIYNKLLQYKKKVYTKENL